MPVGKKSIARATNANSSNPAGQPEAKSSFGIPAILKELPAEKVQPDEENSITNDRNSSKQSYNKNELPIYLL